MRTIYLDNAATTFPKPSSVVEAVTDCITRYGVAPRRGIHSLAREAEEALQSTAEELKRRVGAELGTVVFVPSATYALNVIMQGMDLGLGDCIAISPFEHNAVARCAEWLRAQRGVQWLLLPIKSDGTLDVDAFVRQLGRYRPKLVVITHASNVNGRLMPVVDCTRIAHQFGAKVLIDGAQTVGAYDSDFKHCDYDYLAFSSHKGLYGISGAGGLVIRRGEDTLQPLVHGGTGSASELLTMPDELPDRLQAGTLPLPSIVSMKAGSEWISQVGETRIRQHVQSICRTLMSGLVSIPSVKLVDGCSSDGVGIVSFTSDMYTPQEISMILDASGICTRAGLHCAPLAHRTLGTLPRGTVRVSISYFNTEEDAHSLLAALDTALG